MQAGAKVTRTLSTSSFASSMTISAIWRVNISADVGPATRSDQRIMGSGGATHPFWSPDGRSVGFFADRKLKKVELASGNVHVICDVAGAGGGGSWNADDVIIFSAAMGNTTGLWRVSASGGPATGITPTEAGRRDGWPRFLRDGKRFIYLRAGRREQGVYLGRLASTDAHTMIMSAASAPPTKAIVADDVIFFLNQATLMAQRFDATRMAPVGDPVRVAENVRWGPPGTAGIRRGVRWGDCVSATCTRAARTIDAERHCEAN